MIKPMSHKNHDSVQVLVIVKGSILSKSDQESVPDSQQTTLYLSYELKYLCKD